jgi:outer membrane protein OmpA-like peptidoglycan-associated protein
MAIKKYTALIGFLCLLASGSYAQIGTSYDVQDSSLITRKRLPQHNEFMNNAYPFPAKPRNQWEVGIKGGLFNIFGDVPTVFPTFGGGLHVRKALGYMFSLRAEFMYGVGKGLNWKGRGSGINSAWRGEGYGVAPLGIVFDNYRTVMKDLNLQAIISFNNIRFHQAKSNWNAYGIVGLGASWYKTNINALDDGGNPYNFSSITVQSVYKERKETKNQLKDLMDDSYETPAETDGDARPKLGGNTLGGNFHFGAGLAFRVSPRVNIAIEDRFTVTKNDLLDGQRWQAARTGNPETPFGSILTPDYDTYNYFTVGANFNLGGKSTEPLYWMNPLDYAYNEINAPKHMKLPKPILDDADGDGVTDQFDLEPNTPANAPVDSHGVSKDTDGDGVPDFKDKELITPTQCQPVDADGIGKCPEPACCKELREGGFVGGTQNQCAIGDLPSISFTGRTVSLNNDSKAVLASVAEKIRTNPNCRIAVIGYGESSKSAQQLSWDRVNAVINYLVEQEGISADRFIFKYGEGGGDPNTVDLRDGSAEDGPNAVPAPHPNLRKRN